MRSIITVTEAAADPFMLTTVERVKAELGITTQDNDELLEQKITEAGSAAQAFLGFTVAREGVTETFRPERRDVAASMLILNRAPVGEITSVTVDDEELDEDEYEVDAKAGLLYRVDESGYRGAWYFAKSIVVEYSGGYILPGESNANLEPAIESGVIELVSSFWLSRGRDPLIKAENIPGVMSAEYWVGVTGEAGELPPGVVAKLTPFRRVPV